MGGRVWAELISEPTNIDDVCNLVRRFRDSAASRDALEAVWQAYHTERNHQRLANRIISAEPSHFGKAGTVQRCQRLGGTLSYYYRAA
jgi:hypothetical protein